MKTNKEVTIYDIARKLKYSPSTISRALNNHSSISGKTIGIIKKTAREMGYRPNSIAASLRNNKSKTIGIMISRINRPFVSSLISGIEEKAREAGYNVIISQSNDKYDNEVFNAQTLYNSRISGLVVSLSMETRKLDHFSQFIKQGIPIVFVDRIPDKLKGYKVIIDNYAAGYKAAEHLIQQGCKRIAHFAGAQHRNVYRERKHGMLDALNDYNIAVNDDLIIDCQALSFEEGAEGMRRLMNLPQPPDGLFAANDTSAVSAILYAKKHGIDIPRDLAIIGFNDDPIASIVDPPLSTITHPAIEMGNICTERILQHITDADKKDSDAPEIITLPTELLMRASSLRHTNP
ncbi:LacI family DNA-binding transcriptional regulator [Sinomicrobium soli]|uniref:LacI family DNA-binding transcriptional regulator n=1 Tax=Sinomicrobium sp. N-1-3-6 TaxID=2219864 RepID=UPI000DCC1CD7|nr:LacI family DNA-binding transcriptional regulator [Sinomicrobium sp. N-1-3-6]RAV29630.1 LacI family transcriptional regulator [Sinomicrobium sp. N-1-3-6]